METLTRSLVMVVAVSLAAIGTTPAIAQSADATTSAASAPSTKAERKAARKEARAAKNAELKKLEDAGYSPATANASDYPQNYQNAQAKAATTSQKAPVQ